MMKSSADYRRHRGLRIAATIAACATWLPACGAESQRPPVATRAADTGPHWSFQPITRPNVPNVRDPSWPRGAIDRFILSRMEDAQLSPTTDADRATLLRRVTFDLIGLPPTPEQLDAFLADPNPHAFTIVVDRLLASPQFGERWGQHWLDVARFADSSGGGRSMMFPQAWRYRDYVIDAFNSDLPIDRFIVEQLAGDLLPAENPAQRDRQAIATGLLVLGAINYELQDKELLEVEIADEQIDMVGRALLGMTLGCARCHDHKFDPIPAKEYYGLAGIFLSTQSVQHANVGKYMTVPLEAGPEVAAYDEFQDKLAAMENRLKRVRNRVKLLAQADSDELIQADSDSSPAEDHGSVDLDAARQEAKQLADQMKRLKAQAPLEAVAMAVQDAEQPGDTHLLIGGVIREFGPVVPRCFLSAASSSEPSHSDPVIASGQSGRLELARWIASPQNPLTARVFVNRVWHYLFGAGLVRTTDNFGRMGEVPSHPELLDYLATTLIEEGWSSKALIRRITLSRTYQMASLPSDKVPRIDSENRLLCYFNRRPLDAESLRDAMLLISGLLDESAGGPSIGKLSEYDHGYQHDSLRRSVYIPRFRAQQLDMFTFFDGANANVVCGRRAESILPTQALFLMNSPFSMRMAEATAQRLQEESDDDCERIDLLSRRALGRLPAAAEQTLYQDYLRDMQQELGDETLANWSGLCQLLFTSNDFRYVK